MPRPRKPDHLKVVDGDREDRINRDAPMPNLTSLAPPVALSDRAEKFWDQLAPDMKNRGILSDWDLPILAQLCDALARYFEYGDLLEAANSSDDSPGRDLAKSARGVTRHPYVQMQRDANAMVVQMASRFGMTPADRSKLSVKSQDGTPTGLDELIS